MVTIKSRYPCPFYGFDQFLRDTKGNQCELLRGYHGCKMEIGGLVPIVEDCPIGRNTNFSDFDEVRIQPREFIPKDGSSWIGIRFIEWRAYLESINKIKQ